MVYFLLSACLLSRVAAPRRLALLDAAMLVVLMRVLGGSLLFCGRVVGIHLCFFALILPAHAEVAVHHEDGDHGERSPKPAGNTTHKRPDSRLAPQ